MDVKFTYICIHPHNSLQSLLSYFSSDNVSLLPLFVIFSFSFLYPSSPTQSLAHIPYSMQGKNVFADH